MTADLTGPPLLGDEADLFLELHTQLVPAIARLVPDVVSAAEEACAFAWAELVRLQPRRDNIAAWLHVVARHEAIRLAKHARREGATTRSISSDGLHRTIEARAALGLVRALPPRKRAALGMQVAGYSHAEIGRALRMTPRTVDRQIQRARTIVRAQAA